MTADYIKRLRSKPTLEDDYSSLIKVLRECGFTKCPSSGAPLDNLQCLSEEAKELWMQSRYYDWFLLEQPVGSSEFEIALRQYERARQELTAQLTADHACVKDGLDLVDLDANDITVISSSGSSGSSDHTYTHTQSGEALTISYSDAEMRDGKATDAMCEFNKNVAEQKDCSLEDVVYTSEPMPLSAQAAAVIDSALSGEGIDSDGVRLETQRGRGKKLIVDGVFGQGFEEYGLTQADGGTVAERNKAQRDNTLRLLPSCFEAMQKKRSTLATQGIDVFDSYFDFKTLYSERPGAALVLAYVYLAEESQKLAGGGKYGDSHCVNTANPNAEFGWHIDNHLQLEEGQYLETSVIWQCSNGRASVKVAGFGELTYPGVGGVVTFPAWALHRSGIVDPETPERMWKLAFFFEPPGSSGSSDHTYTSGEDGEGQGGVTRTPTGGQQFGLGTSQFWCRYITEEFERRLLKFCMWNVPFQLYKMNRAKNRASGGWRYIAPKCEYFILTKDGKRGVYYWGQSSDFYHAGYEMEGIVLELCKKLNADFGLEGDDQINSIMILANEQSGSNPRFAHHAPLHGDKHRKSFFFDLSLGYVRAMELTSKEPEHKISDDIILTPGGEKKPPVENYIVARQELASGSLAFISALDNADFKHMVRIDETQPLDEPRFSVVGRSKSEHPHGAKAGEHFMHFDSQAAARVRQGGDLFKPYVLWHRLSPEARAERLREVGWTDGQGGSSTLLNEPRPHHTYLAPVSPPRSHLISSHLISSHLISHDLIWSDLI